MQESNLSKLIQLELSKAGTTSFRNNTGTGWQGTRRPGGNGLVILEDARPLHAGLCKGSSDLIGWTAVTVTPEMVGKKVAVFTAIEVKTKSGKLTPEQQHFLQTVENAGGYAGVARSPEDALTIVRQGMV